MPPICQRKKLLPQGRCARVDQSQVEHPHSWSARAKEGTAHSVQREGDGRCLLNIVHESKGDNTYANTQGASPLPKGMKTPEQYNETRLMISTQLFGMKIEKLPDLIKKKMQSSEEWTLRENFDRANVGNFKPKSLRQEAEDTDIDFENI